MHQLFPRLSPVLRQNLEKVVIRGIFAQTKPQTACSIVNPTKNIHTNEPMNDIFEITNEKDFKHKVMRNSLPVIVNFHADWCEPCHALKPLLEKIANENLDRIHLAEVLVDDNIDLLHAFEVTAVPAVLGIHRGVVIEKFVGLVTHKQVLEFVNKLVQTTAD